MSYQSPQTYNYPQKAVKISLKTSVICSATDLIYRNNLCNKLEKKTFSPISASYPFECIPCISLVHQRYTKN